MGIFMLEGRNLLSKEDKYVGRQTSLFLLSQENMCKSLVSWNTSSKLCLDVSLIE